MSEEKTTTTEEKKFKLLTIANEQDVATLRKVSDTVAFVLGDNSGQLYIDKNTKELVQALKDYVMENDGLGMAAIQLGVAKRVFVMRKPFSSDQIITVINPKLIRGEGKSVGVENCFSVPNLPENVKGAKVQRQSRIFVDYTDEDGVAYKEEMFVGLDARIFLHELDHLDGKLLLDDPKFKGWASAY